MLKTEGMELSFENNRLKGTLVLSDELHQNKKLLTDRTLYKFLWVTEGKIVLEVDEQRIDLAANEMLTLTPLHHVRFLELEGKYRSLLFNSNFYCIHGNDHEVSCNGLLFHGSSHLVKFVPERQQWLKINTLVGILEDEFVSRDHLQEEMLRILLKRFIILSTRIVQQQLKTDRENGMQFETIRKFYVLVDTYFREKKQVQEYADLLNKSPKTLANILSAYGLPSAIRIIHERLEAEARRLLLYTSKSSKEIALVLGFEEQASFARFFKNTTGESCSEFRKNRKEGKL